MKNFKKWLDQALSNKHKCKKQYKKENKVKGKLESFFIESKGKLKSGLNKFKVNRTTYTYKKEETIDSFIVVNKKNI